MSFKGAITMLSELIADKLVGALIEGGTITGAILQTSDAGNRLVIKSNGQPGLDSRSIVEMFADILNESPGQLVQTVQIIGLANGTQLQQPVLQLIGGTTPDIGHASAFALIPGMDASGIGGPQMQVSGNLDSDTLTVSGLVQFFDALAVTGLLTARAGLKLAGRQLNGIDFGSTGAVSLVTDADGDVTINHGLGVIPAAITLTSRMRNRNLNILSQTATQFVVRVTDDTNTVLVGANVQLDWMVLS